MSGTTQPFPLNTWIHFATGSVRASNRLRFSDERPNAITLSLSYLFDGDTMEVVDLEFDIDPLAFRNFLNDLARLGDAHLQTNMNMDRLTLDMRRVETGLQFRMDGSMNRGTGYNLGYIQPEYVDLIM